MWKWINRNRRRQRGDVRKTGMREAMAKSRIVEDDWKNKNCVIEDASDTVVAV